jgi:hypothetical protein
VALAHKTLRAKGADVPARVRATHVTGPPRAGCRWRVRTETTHRPGLDDYARDSLRVAAAAGRVVDLCLDPWAERFGDAAEDERAE